MPQAVPSDAWEECRDYLRVLARQGLGMSLRSEVDESDLVQETLIQAYRKKHQFRGRSRGELLAWLRTIMKRKLIDIWRKHQPGDKQTCYETDVNQALEQSSLRMAQWLQPSEQSPSSIVARDEQLLNVAKVIQRLPENQRDAIELHYLREYSFSEVGKKMGVNRNQAAGLIRRGLKSLRREFSDLSGENLNARTS